MDEGDQEKGTRGAGGRQRRPGQPGDRKLTKGKKQPSGATRGGQLHPQPMPGYTAVGRMQIQERAKGGE